MKFAIIDATKREVKTVDLPSFDEAYAEAGLEQGHVDFGTLIYRPDFSGVSIVVYEYGLFAPPEEGHYFSIDGRLFEGNAVISAFDSQGEDADYDRHPSVVFYASAEEVEQAIGRGEIQRPQTAINGEVVWQWPPKPDEPHPRKETL